MLEHIGAISQTVLMALTNTEKSRQYRAAHREHLRAYKRNWKRRDRAIMGLAQALREVPQPATPEVVRQDG